MFLNIYNKYFAKDKPLRHYTQHFIVALIGYYLLIFLKVELNLRKFIIFLIASFIVDLDGLISVFIFKNKIMEAGEIVRAIKLLRFTEAATIAVKHHKKLNRLIIHNVVGFLLIIGLVMWSMFVKNQIALTVSWAVLFHFLFDIYDDIYQLRHIKNWLWPLLINSKPSNK